MLEASINRVAEPLPGVPVDENHQRYIAENQGTDQLPAGASVGGSVAAVDSSGGAGHAGSAELGELDSNDREANAPAKSSDAVVQVLQDMFSFFGRNKSQPTAAAAEKKPRLFLFGDKQKKKRPAKKQNIN